MRTARCHSLRHRGIDDNNFGWYVWPFQHGMPVSRGSDNVKLLCEKADQAVQ
jgi:hypothetical protein